MTSSAIATARGNLTGRADHRHVFIIAAVARLSRDSLSAVRQAKQSTPAPAARWTASSQGLLAVTGRDERQLREAFVRPAAPLSRHCERQRGNPSLAGRKCQGTRAAGGRFLFRAKRRTIPRSVQRPALLRCAGRAHSRDPPAKKKQGRRFKQGAHKGRPYACRSRWGRPLWSPSFDAPASSPFHPSG
jgi:hypothetical protein